MTVPAPRPPAAIVARRQDAERGSALLSVILISLLVSALLAGFMSMVMADQRAGYSNRDQTTAYAAAHAGLEQLTADLGELFATNFRPTSAQVNAIMATPPDVGATIAYQQPGGAAGSGYRITFTDANGDGFPDAEAQPRLIQAGPYEGLRGTVTPYTIEVTARTPTGGEVRMRRQMQTVLIPAFQFGIYSENDLSFFAGPSFDFGGRVHTNNNLFLAEGDGNVLSLRDRVTAVGEVVRTNLSNGWPTSSNYTGTVRIARTAGTTATLVQCTSTTPTPSPSGCNSVAMSTSQGSWAAAAPQLPPAPLPGVIPPPGSNENTWTTFSTSTANGNVKNARTGARPLVLPLVQMGAEPIDLIRRPAAGSAEDTTNAAVYGQRYYTRASLRVLLSDTAADITTLPGVDTLTPPVDLSTLVVATAPPHPTGWYKAGTTNLYANFAESGAPAAPPADPNAYYAPGGSWYVPGTKLVTGFIKIEMQRPNGTWVDVTTNVLSLGYTGARLSRLAPACAGTNCGSSFKAPLTHSDTAYYLNDRVFGAAPSSGSAAPTCAPPSPNAVIRLQRVRDDHNPRFACGIGTPNTFDFVPNVLFDPREGNLRDNNPTADTSLAPIYLGGLMHYIELDVRNLAVWLAARAATVDPPESGDGGYLVYVSDRRTAARVGGAETGEYGFEDIVNPAAVTTMPNGALDDGEDLNGEDRDGDGSNLDVYGQVPNAGALGNLRTSATANGTALSAAVRPWHSATSREARQNQPLFFRRAVKLVNGADTATSTTVSALTVLPAGTGLTIVSENPVYVQGDYNIGSASTAFGNAQTDHRPSAVIADSVTLVSNLWSDIRSFHYVLDSGTGDCNGAGGFQFCNGTGNPARRPGDTTFFRMGVVAGKGLSFLRPSWAPQDFGTDGGAHNFLRFIEDWAGTLNYRGSIISFYESRQGVGTYKCCTNVYDPPARGYRFDTEFLDLALLPPKSPAFRDVNTLTFRQILRPTQ